MGMDKVEDRGFQVSSLNNCQAGEKINVKVGNKEKVKVRVKTAKQHQDIGGWIGGVKGLETQKCILWSTSVGAVSLIS